jgi:vancomycin resistance protein YoaR
MFAIVALVLASSASFAGAPRAQDLTPPADSLRAVEERFPILLGSFTTTLIGSRPERTANIRLAADALDGAVIAPGEELSFNRVVGARSPQRGYQSAPVILHETRQLQTGGGVCQVASTVFAAGMLSGLSCAERWRHSSPVDYIALGEDATISWGAKDLRLRNVLDQSVSARFEGETPSSFAYELATDERELPPDPGMRIRSPSSATARRRSTGRGTRGRSSPARDRPRTRRDSP